MMDYKFKKRDDLESSEEDEESTENETNTSEENDTQLEDKDASVAGDEAHVQSGRVDEWEPFVGMEFDSFDQAKEYFKQYARHVGFRVRIQNSHRSALDKEKQSGTFVCSKEGFRLKRSDPGKKARAITRVGCLAMMKVNRVTINNKYCVTQFKRDHNHQVGIPSKELRLSSERSVCSCARQPLIGKVATRSTMSQAVSVTSKQSGEASKVNCKENDSMDSIRTEIIGSLKMEDAQAAIQLLRDQAIKNENFFYAIDVDERGQLRNVLWIEARSRLAYGVFGDVVTFDTTYLTNKYRIPFASFLGANHHCRAILFGCALIGDESEESFVWVLETWLGAMRGFYPKVIITGHCLTQKLAVAKVLPNTCHRFCLRHICAKFNKYLGSLGHIRKGLMSDFENCLHYNGTTDGFEDKWESFLETYNLKENNWLNLLYQDRHQWSPMFIQSNTFVGMSIIQRSDNVNSVIDGYVTKEMTLNEFVELYNDVVQRENDKEKEAEYESVCMEPVMRTKSPLERHAAQLYTRNIFKKIQVEIYESGGYFSESVDSGNIQTYKMISYEDETKIYEVIFNKADEALTCQCHLFEFSGFLCRHIFAVLMERHVRDIPSEYILHRWRKDACKEYIHNQTVDMGGRGVQSESARFNNVMHYVMQYAVEASKSNESYHQALHLLEEGLKKIDDTNASVVRSTPSCGKSTKPNILSVEISQKPESELDGKSVMDESCGMIDPPYAINLRSMLKTKRMTPPCEKVIQLKSAKKSGRSRTRTCSICNVTGHDMRTCKAIPHNDEVIYKASYQTVDMGGRGVQSESTRFNNVMHYAMQYAVEASKSNESYHQALHLLEEGLKKIEDTNASVVRSTASCGKSTNPNILSVEISQNPESELNDKSVMDESCGMIDPPYINLRSMLKTKRMTPPCVKVIQLKSAKKSWRSRTRTCSICNVTGHDMRTCKAIPHNDVVIYKGEVGV